MIHLGPYFHKHFSLIAAVAERGRAIAKSGVKKAEFPQERRGIMTVICWRSGGTHRGQSEGSAERKEETGLLNRLRAVITYGKAGLYGIRIIDCSGDSYPPMSKKIAGMEC